MSTEDKERILRSIFEVTNIIEEEDKSAIIAYIRGTSDTRERIKMEQQTA